MIECYGINTSNVSLTLIQCLQLPKLNLKEVLDSNVKAIFEKPIIDELIHAELHLPQREKLMSAKVIGRTHDDDDNLNINQIKLESSSMEPSYLLVSSL